jgi:uncharacterized protein (DUF433 family)
MSRQVIGNYIVADSEICHGKLTFIGTRIMVFQILEMVADGQDWDSISEAWGGKVSKEAIAEAVNLASQVLASHAFIEHMEEYNLEPLPA